MTTLACADLRKWFTGTAALDGVSMTFPRCGIVAIIGPNGAGKTTLLNTMTGFVRPDEGYVTLGQSELTRLPPHRIARLGVCRTFQSVRLIELLSALENVMLMRRNQKGERLWHALTGAGVKAEERLIRGRALEVLDQVGLAGDAQREAGTLSYGQQKLLTLACCLTSEAQILLLDEPVAGVHPDVAQRVLALLQKCRDDGRLIVFVEHDIGAVRQVADRVIVMDDGRVIADGVPEDVLERPEILEAYIG